jgi:hypothetical protein
MRWPVGKSADLKYREWLNKKRQWNKWFAWYPVSVLEERVWLEWVERKGWTSGVGESGTVYWEYEYRFIGARNE